VITPHGKDGQERRGWKTIEGSRGKKGRRIREKAKSSQVKFMVYIDLAFMRNVR